MNRFKTGLTSVTFRQKSTDEIIAMAKKRDLPELNGAVISTFRQER